MNVSRCVKKICLAAGLLTIGTSLFGRTVVRKTSIHPNSCFVQASSELVPEPEIDYLKMQCPGFEGYKVYVSGADARYDLQLTYNDKKISLHNPGPFKDLMDQPVEWRGEVVDEELELKGLIYSRWEYDLELHENKGVYVAIQLQKENSKLLKTLPANKQNLKLLRDLVDGL